MPRRKFIIIATFPEGTSDEVILQSLYEDFADEGVIQIPEDGEPLRLDYQI